MRVSHVFVDFSQELLGDVSSSVDRDVFALNFVFQIQATRGVSYGRDVNDVRADRVLDVDGESLAEVRQSRADCRELDECLESICR